MTAKNGVLLKIVIANWMFSFADLTQGETLFFNFAFFGE